VKGKHHELHVWQEAVALVKEVYRNTASFPKEELYALITHMRRGCFYSQ
jgi:four helix bundle protein